MTITMKNFNVPMRDWYEMSLIRIDEKKHYKTFLQWKKKKFNKNTILCKLIRNLFIHYWHNFFLLSAFCERFQGSIYEPLHMNLNLMCSFYIRKARNVEILKGRCVNLIFYHSISRVHDIGKESLWTTYLYSKQSVNEYRCEEKHVGKKDTAASWSLFMNEK